MKLISFTVPCYNSQDYMKKCIDSLLVGGDDVEIIIVNDGSKDNTLSIAEDYKSRYPDIVKVIDKPNGGHGSGVNSGVDVATGLYYKVVDSDDWLDCGALLKLLETIKTHISEGQTPDMYVTNFVYEKVSENMQHVNSNADKFPVGQICTWDKVKAFRFSRYMMMHALIYKREKYLASGTRLPEHTFYVDNIYAYRPLPYMQTLCYLDLDLYRYFIGRADQSVNMANFVKRYEQQLRVMQLMTDAYTWKQIKSQPKGLKKYMIQDMQLIMLVTLFFTCAEYSPERKAALKDMWRHIKQTDKGLYNKIRHRSYATLVVYLPYRFRGWVMKIGYNICCRRLKLG